MDARIEFFFFQRGEALVHALRVPPESLRQKSVVCAQWSCPAVFVRKVGTVPGVPAYRLLKRLETGEAHTSIKLMDAPGNASEIDMQLSTRSVKCV